MTFDRRHLSESESTSLQRLERLGKLLDNQFELPIIGYRVGLDPLLGLLPVGGDWATSLVGLYIAIEAFRLRVSIGTIAIVLGRVLLDLFVGWIPVAGDIFDAAYKSNARNVRAIKQDLRDRDQTVDRKMRTYQYWAALGSLVALGCFISLLPFALLWFAIA